MERATRESSAWISHPKNGRGRRTTTKTRERLGGDRRASTTVGQRFFERWVLRRDRPLVPKLQKQFGRFLEERAERPTVRSEPGIVVVDEPNPRFDRSRTTSPWH